MNLRLGTTVKEVGNGHVLLADGTNILSHTVIWAGGLQASQLCKCVGIQTGHGGRLDVQPDLTVQGFQGVYVLGDFANITGKDGKPLPQLASVAEQTGKWCAKNIEFDIAGKDRQPFHYFDKGIMAMIGRDAAVAEVGKHRHELHGTIAFSAWLGVHAALLTTSRAKVGAFTEWAWNYFGHSHGELILDQPDQANINWNEVYVVVKYWRRASDDDRELAPIYGSDQVGIAWTVIPVLIVVVLFLAAARVIHAVEDAQFPPAALEVTAVGHHFWWEFRYPTN